MIAAIQNNPLLLYIIAGGFALLISVIVSLIIFSVRRNTKKTVYDDQLEELLNDGAEDADSTEVTFANKWNRYWHVRFSAMGWARYSDNQSKAGKDATIISIILIILLTIAFRNPIPSIIMTAILMYVFASFLKSKELKETERINIQLPGFLFALKANIQANETPERAFLKIVDGMPEPLYTDLLVVKQRILANSSFKEALEELSAKTASKDLKFLSSCIIQATGTGANLENQITVIQKVLDARRKVSDELSKAIRQATPAIWVASFVLPITFFAAYFLDSTAQEFWFKDLIAWGALFLVFALYLTGVFLTKKLVDNIRNL